MPTGEIPRTPRARRNAAVLVGTMAVIAGLIYAGADHGTPSTAAPAKPSTAAPITGYPRHITAAKPAAKPSKPSTVHAAKHSAAPAVADPCVDPATNAYIEPRAAGCPAEPTGYRTADHAGAAS